MKIIVLGCGLVGKPMAIDLAPDFDVTVADISAENLNKIGKEHGIKTIQQDLSNKNELSALLKDFDLVVNAVPGFMGFETLRTIIEAGKDVVEIAFSPEDVMLLDELARQNGVTAICDMGVAPGMSNVLIGHVTEMMDKTEKVRIYVGGLPKNVPGLLSIKHLFLLLMSSRNIPDPHGWSSMGRKSSKKPCRKWN